MLMLMDVLQVNWLLRNHVIGKGKGKMVPQLDLTLNREVYFFPGYFR